MIIFDNITDAASFPEKTAVTVGKFDGIHVGHRELIRRIVSKKKEGLVPTVLTIDMNTEDGGLRKNILSLAEENRLFEALGVEILVRVPFTKEFASTEASDFITEVLVSRLHASYVVSGEDFRFGAGRKGGRELLYDMSVPCGYTFEAVPRLSCRELPVSSTRIRALLAEGSMEEACECMGSPYTVEGKVIHGMALAASLGFPTANIRPEAEKLLPAYGVYRVEASIGGAEYKGLANLGVKPTVRSEKDPLLEVYFPGFSGNLYGEKLEVSFEHFIRKERKFKNVFELKKQIESDLLQVSDAR
ncbi:MAG: riboflavin biosynthesis protein RibF [Lachnospiraceae bacterium]|nr:riboflavin biosynthesis protein RibF [Lachnospiraceae bacterium]